MRQGTVGRADYNNVTKNDLTIDTTSDEANTSGTSLVNPR